MSTTEPRISKRRIGAVIAAAATFAIVSASAATLGGLDTAWLGANDNAVAAPVDAGVTLSFVTDYQDASYVVTGIALVANRGQSIPANAKVKVTLADKDGVSLGEYASADGGAGWTLPSTAVKAEDVDHAAVVINGAPVSSDTDD